MCNFNNQSVMRKILLVALSLFLISAWTAQAQYGVKVSYEPAIYTESMNSRVVENLCYDGVSMGLHRNFSFFEKVPLNINVGLGANYMVNKSVMSGLPRTRELWNVFVPLQVSYDFSIGKQMKLSPYVGVYGRFFLSYKEISQISQVDYHTRDYFSEKGFTRGLLGGSVGFSVKVSNHFQFDLGYGWDFSDFYYIGRTVGGDISERIRHFSFGVSYYF